jgi:hypothetical protein
MVSMRFIPLHFMKASPVKTLSYQGINLIEFKYKTYGSHYPSN